jgi:putative DNA methylase
VKKIVEEFLPLHDLNLFSTSDKVRKGHPGYLHLWWNRSPIASSEAVLYSAVTDVPKDSENKGKEKQKIVEIAEGNTKQVDQNDLPTVVDPFSGFGGLTIASQKLGLHTKSGDLNSVAALLTKAATELPSRFANAAAVNPGIIRNTLSGTQGIASDVQYYGNVMFDCLKKKLAVNYPQHHGQNVYSWIWVRTVECANPACKREVPLSSSYVLSKSKGGEYWAEPALTDGQLTFTIHKGKCPADKATNKVGSQGAKFVCPFCGELNGEDHIRAMGKAHRLGKKIMAVVTETDEGRVYSEPKYEQVEAALKKYTGDLPVGEFPHNSRWFSPPGFGMTEYADLFTERQLIFLDTMSNLIQKVRRQIEVDALKAGMLSDKQELDAGGTGAYAYSEMIITYLSLVMGKLVNFNSEACTWDNRKGNVRAAFTRQAIPMTWTFPEGNPFGNATGNFKSMLKDIVEAIPSLSENACIEAYQGDALKCSFPKNSMLFTELPYLDNVGYADLSDYFYIWLRKCLKSIYPSLFEKVVSSKDELCTIPEHYEGDAERAKTEYSKGLIELFDRFYPNASIEYPSLIFFAYSKQDDEIVLGDLENEYSAFEEFIGSIVHAGFVISAIWPIRTEKASKSNDSIRILTVIRKTDQERGQITRRGFINTLKHDLNEQLELRLEDVDEEDRRLVAMGAGLDSFTGFNKVLNADGSVMTVHQALVLIRQEVDNYFLANNGSENEGKGV